MINADIHLTATRWRDEATGNGCTWFIRGQIQPDNDSAFVHYLGEAHGFYAAICRQDNQLMAAVDHIRSIPLFYGLMDNRLYLSDSAEWVRQNIGDDQMDPITRAEFQLTGYVTGRDTLFPNVKQLQAGEYLIAETIHGRLTLSHGRHYRFVHREVDSYDEPSLRDALDDAAVSTVQCLIDYADGRQIVVPLSGGYDSRLIALLLKRLNYENVLTFTYGTTESREVAYSKRIAETLGLKWVFVEYSVDAWHEAWQTDERRKYHVMSSGWSSLPHVQDWLAVKILKAKGMIADDCVFAPGHTGDFISGGHIPEEAFSSQQFSLKTVSAAILRKHYDLVPLRSSGMSVGAWQRRIADLLDHPEISNAADFASTCETWEWQERQAKFIANAVRVYEFFDYDWWMPLWDKEFVQFWKNVPLVLRKNRAWYIDYVNRLYAGYARNNESRISGNAATAHPMRLKVGRLAKRILPGLLQRYLWKKKQIQDLQHHPNAIYGRFDHDVWTTYFAKGYLLNGIYAAVFLDSVNDLIRDQP